MFINIYKDTCLLIFTKTHVYLYLHRHTVFINIYIDMFIYIYTDTCLFIFIQEPSVYLYIDTCLFKI